MTFVRTRSLEAHRSRDPEKLRNFAALLPLPHQEIVCLHAQPGGGARQHWANEEQGQDQGQVGHHSFLGYGMRVFVQLFNSADPTRILYTRRGTSD